MPNFEKEFEFPVEVSNDNEIWLALDASIPIDEAVRQFCFKACCVVREEEIVTGYMRFGFYNGRNCWHLNDYNGNGTGHKKVWLWPFNNN